MEVSDHVSPVAALPFVRAAMVALQQAMGRDKGVVMDGATSEQPYSPTQS